MQNFAIGKIQGHYTIMQVPIEIKMAEREWFQIPLLTLICIFFDFEPYS